MTIWIGKIGITVHSGKENYIRNLSKRFSGFIDNTQGQIDLEIVETNFKPEITKKGDEYFWFTMFSGNIYVYIEYANWTGKAFICEETPVRYDSIDSMLTMIAAQFSPMFGSILAHGCCIDYDGTGLCFMGDSGVGKSTLTKILSSDYQIIAEDMFSIGCYEEKIVAYSIPLGQKHFWVENKKNVVLKNICFVQSGEMNIEAESNRKKILDTLLHNQFYKARTNDIALMDAMRFSINRIFKNVSFYNFSWDTERFYIKDRAYIKDVKNSIASIPQSSYDKKQIKPCNDNVLSLNKHVRIREDSIKNRLELWDSSIHRLYGIPEFGKAILCYANEKSQFTMMELKEYLESRITVESNVLINILNELLDKNIIKGGRISDEQILCDQ